MSSTDIILLAGVAGVWIGLLVAAIAVLRALRAVYRLEFEMERLRREMDGLVPRVGGALDELARMGSEISKTASSARTLMESADKRFFKSAAAGVAGYLPLAAGIARIVLPIVFRRHR